jgi:MFS family permease
MAVGYMYVDRIAPVDVRGSMQTLYGVFVIALGFFVGSVGGGIVADHFSEQVGETIISDWPRIWLSCAAVCALSVVLFLLFFPNRDPEVDPSSVSKGDEGVT